MSTFEPIQEAFLHFVWQGLFFDLQQLSTTDGHPLQVVNNGRLNSDQGPDFLQACIRINGLEWYGQVEMHLRTRDWYRHGHQEDPFYNPVILHVVYESDGSPVQRQDGSIIPELELKAHISQEVLQRYQHLRLAQGQLPCTFGIRDLPASLISSWLEQLAVERVRLKAARMQQQLQQRLQAGTIDWEQSLWEELAAMLAAPVNQEAMRQVAIQVPYGLLSKYIDQPHYLEALLFGGAGLLRTQSPAGDAYYQQLRTNWRFLSHKHDLRPSSIALKFLRMRPAAFPTLRLAQLAQLVCHIKPLIRLMEPYGYDQLLQTPVQASSYWHHHLRFGEAVTRPKPRRLGKQQKEILVLNVILPLAMLYAQAHGRARKVEDLAQPMRQLGAERNRHTRLFEELGVENQHAMHAQGMIQLHKHYCLEKRCMHCNIGKRLVAPGNA